MPYYREKLLSAWPNDRVFEVGKPTPTVDSDILKFSRRGPANIGQIVPNNRKLQRNQIDGPLVTNANGHSATEPKYLSDKTRVSTNGQDEGEDPNDITTAFAKFALFNNAGDAPHGYEKLRIKYGGPRGVQDFDFGLV